jgi:hypothetical protein
MAHICACRLRIDADPDPDPAYHFLNTEIVRYRSELSEKNGLAPGSGRN